MAESISAGGRLRIALAEERPLQVVGAVSAYAALLAQASGFRALYLSGGGVAASSCGLPDLGVTTLEDVLTDVRRITRITPLPLLVDIDTGWGDLPHAIRTLTEAGAAGVHIEDQAPQKRCGHRPGKILVSGEEMAERIRTAAAARSDSQFVIMARTDALAAEGIGPAIERAQLCADAGADMIFPEAVETLDQYRRFTRALDRPVLANLTEFGRTPLFTLPELRDAGVALALYPLSAFRAMSAAALDVYQTIRRDGTQRDALDQMQSREDLYRHLDYHRAEQKIDEILGQPEEPR